MNGANLHVFLLEVNGSNFVFYMCFSAERGNMYN